MNITRSVSTRIAHYLFLIIIFAGTITLLSLVIIESNKSDAELINVSGSLRMQSYRLLYMMEYEPQNVETALRQYRLSLHSYVLMDLKDQWFAPDNVKQSYRELIQRWKQFENYVLQNDQASYRNEIASYVNQLDRFVYTLQRISEQKLTVAVMVILISLLLIVTMVSYVIWYTRCRWDLSIISRWIFRKMTNWAILPRYLPNCRVNCVGFIAT